MHAGIYYAPGSLKAKLCVEGLDLAYKYCDKHNIPYKKVGKVSNSNRHHHHLGYLGQSSQPRTSCS